MFWKVSWFLEESHKVKLTLCLGNAAFNLPEAISHNATVRCIEWPARETLIAEPEPILAEAVPV